jgi:hypothetical protein
MCARTFPPPLIPLVSKVKKMDKVDNVDGPDTQKSKLIKLEFFINPFQQALGSKYSRQFAIFKEVCPGDWIKWVMAFREI